MSSYNEMNLSFSAGRAARASSLVSISSVWSSVKMSSQTFLLSLKNGSMLTPIYQPGTKMMSVINERYHGSRTLFWNVGCRFILKPWGGFCFSNESDPKCYLTGENRWKRFCQDNLPKFPNLFIYLFIFISEIRWEKILRILFLMFKKWGKMSGSFFIYLFSLKPCKNRCWRFFTPMCETKWKKNSWNFFLKNQVNNFYPGVRKK